MRTCQLVYAHRGDSKIGIFLNLEWNGSECNRMNIIISGLTSDQNIGDIRFEVSSERPEERRIEPQPLN